MKQARLRILGSWVLAGMCLCVVSVYPAEAQVKSAAGKIAGVVNDTSGVPQLGATVELVPEVLGTAPVDFLTNTQGVFRGEKLTPGLYTVRVTLAGFLPTLQQHVRVTAHLTTVVRIQLESMFASLDQLRLAHVGKTSQHRVRAVEDASLPTPSPTAKKKDNKNQRLKKFQSNE